MPFLLNYVCPDCNNQIIVAAENMSYVQCGGGTLQAATPPQGTYPVLLRVLPPTCPCNGNSGNDNDED